MLSAVIRHSIARRVSTLRSDPRRTLLISDYQPTIRINSILSCTCRFWYFFCRATPLQNAEIRSCSPFVSRTVSCTPRRNASTYRHVYSLHSAPCNSILSLNTDARRQKAYIFSYCIAGPGLRPYGGREICTLLLLRRPTSRGALYYTAELFLNSARSLVSHIAERPPPSVKSLPEFGS